MQQADSKEGFDDHFLYFQNNKHIGAKKSKLGACDFKQNSLLTRTHPCWIESFLCVSRKGNFFPQAKRHQPACPPMLGSRLRWQNSAFAHTRGQPRAAVTHLLHNDEIPNLDVGALHLHGTCKGTGARFITVSIHLLQQAVPASLRPTSQQRPPAAGVSPATTHAPPPLPPKIQPHTHCCASEIITPSTKSS